MIEKQYPTHLAGTQLSKFSSLSKLRSKSPMLLSPLSLLVLSACGGSGGSGGSGGFQAGGNANKGPLLNARAFLDYDGDGEWDEETEPGTLTDATGYFTLTGEAGKENAVIVVLTDDATIDTSSGTVLSGVRLSAEAGATVVSIASTLMQEGGLTEAEVKTVLGLDELGESLLTFNPYSDANIDDSIAAKVEAVSQQVGTVLTAMTAAAQGAGLDAESAFNAALQAVSEEVAERVSSGKDFSLVSTAADIDGNASALSDIATKMKVAITAAKATDDSIDDTAFDAVESVILTAVVNVNTEVAKITDISDAGSSAASKTFSIASVLADQVKAAVTAVKVDPTNATAADLVTFSAEAAVTAAALNAAPSDIALLLVGQSQVATEGVAISVVEGTTNLTVGTIYVQDDALGDSLVSAADEAAALTYTLAGEDSDKFEIADGKLLFLASPDYEAQSSYSVSINVKDEGGKTYSESFSISVEDIDDNILDGNFRINTANEVDATLVDNVVGPNGTATKTTSINLTAVDGEITFGQLELDEPNIQASLSSSASYEAPVVKIAVGLPTVDATHAIKISIIEGADSVRLVSDERLVEIEFDLSVAGSGDAFSLSNGNSVVLSYAGAGEETSSTSLSLDLDHSTFAYDDVTGSLKISLLDAMDALAVLSENNPTDAILSDITTKFSNLIQSSGSYYFSVEGLPILDETGTAITKISGPVNILDVNAAPSFVSVPLASTDTYNLTEDGVVTTSFNTTAIDIDADVYSFYITDASGELVESLAGDYGTLTVNKTTGSYDYSLAANAEQSSKVQALKEAEAVVDEFTISVSDESLSGSESITFKISGANDAPTSVSLANTSVNENAAGAVVGQLSAVDVDGDALTYELSTVSADDSDLFTINSDNALELKSTTTLNKEDASTHVVTVLVSDGTATTTKTFTIQVSDQNDPATGTVAITGDTFITGTLTAAPTITDEDGMGSLSYQWLADGVALDGETSQTLVIPSSVAGQALSVQVSFTDSGGNEESITSDETGIVTVDGGFALKGPLEGAIAFADYNNDGELTAGEPWVATASDGSYALSHDSNLDPNTAYDETGFNKDDYSIVVSMENATDNTSGESYAGAGTTLKAAPGGGVVTPMTTLHEHSQEHATSFASDDLAEALGIDSTKVDILTFNTHADGVDADLAHEVETIQQHLMTTTMMVQSAIKGAGTPAAGRAVSDAVAHDVALDSLINLIIEVHKSNNEVGGSDSVSISGDLDLSDAAHLEELEELIEADLADTSEGGFGKTMADNGTSVSVPVLEYVLEHASNSIKLINEKLDDLASSDFGGLRAGSVSHVKHDVADEIQQMATAARAHYDAWVLANPGATFDAGTPNSDTGVLEGGDWADFDADSYLTLNTASAIEDKIIANKAEVAEHFGKSDLTLLIPETTEITEDTATVSGALRGFGPTGNALEFSVVGAQTGSFGSISLNATTGEYTYTLNSSANEVDALRDGETLSESFVVQVTDGITTTSTQNLRFTINGVDDHFRIQTDELVDAALTDYLSGNISKVTDLDASVSGSVLSFGSVELDSNNVGYGTSGNAAFTPPALSLTLDGVPSLASAKSLTDVTLSLTDGSDATQASGERRIEISFSEIVVSGSGSSAQLTVPANSTATVKYWASTNQSATETGSFTLTNVDSDVLSLVTGDGSSAPTSLEIKVLNIISAVEDSGAGIVPSTLFAEGDQFHVQLTGLPISSEDVLVSSIEGDVTLRNIHDDYFRIQTDEVVDATLTDYLSGNISKVTDLDASVSGSVLSFGSVELDSNNVGYGTSGNAAFTPPALSLTLDGVPSLASAKSLTDVTLSLTDGSDATQASGERRIEISFSEIVVSGSGSSAQLTVPANSTATVKYWASTNQSATETGSFTLTNVDSDVLSLVTGDGSSAPTSLEIKVLNIISAVEDSGTGIVPSTLFAEGDQFHVQLTGLPISSEDVVVSSVEGDVTLRNIHDDYFRIQTDESVDATLTDYLSGSISKLSDLDVSVVGNALSFGSVELDSTNVGYGTSGNAAFTPPALSLTLDGVPSLASAKSLTDVTLSLTDGSDATQASGERRIEISFSEIVVSGSGSSAQLTVPANSTATVKYWASTNQSATETGSFTLTNVDSDVLSLVTGDGSSVPTSLEIKVLNIISAVEDSGTGIVPSTLFAEGDQFHVHLTGLPFASENSVVTSVEGVVAIKELTPPTTTISGVDFDLSNSTIVLSGSEFDTLDISVGSDAKDYLNWDNFVWNVTGTSGSTSEAFTKDDISSAIITNATTMTITLESDKITDLKGTSDFAAQGAADSVDISNGFIRDANLNAAVGDGVTATVGYSNDTAPTITSISITGASGFRGLGSTVELTAEMSVEVQAGSTFVASLNSGEDVIFSATEAGTAMTVSFAITAGMTTGSEPLNVDSIGSTSIKSLGGTSLTSSVIPLGKNIADEKEVLFDTSAPTTTITAVEYTDSGDGLAGTLVLTGNNFTGTNGLGVTQGNDAKSYLNWDNFVWQVKDGSGVTSSVTFNPETEVTSAIVTNNTTMTITLDAAANTALKGTENFAAQGAADSVAISVGFIKDVAGNVSTTDAATLAPAYTDTGRPTVTSFTTTTPTGSYGVGAEIVITATTSEAVGKGGTITATFGFGGTVTLTADAAGTSLTGTYRCPLVSARQPLLSRASRRQRRIYMGIRFRRRFQQVQCLMAKQLRLIPLHRRRLLRRLNIPTAVMVWLALWF